MRGFWFLASCLTQVALLQSGPSDKSTVVFAVAAAAAGVQGLCKQSGIAVGREDRAVGRGVPEQPVLYHGLC